MNKTTYQSLLAGVITTLITVPAWSTESEQPSQESPTAIQPSMEQPHTTTVPSTDMQHPQSSIMNRNPSASTELYTMRPEDLIDHEVKDHNGEKIGKISDVVSRQQDGQIFVVIAQGGFMGMGASKYVLPLQDLTKKVDEIYLRDTVSSASVKEQYLKDRYVSVDPEDRPISDFSAFEENK